MPILSSSSTLEISNEPPSLSPTNHTSSNKKPSPPQNSPPALAPPNKPISQHQSPAAPKTTKPNLAIYPATQVVIIEGKQTFLLRGTRHTTREFYEVFINQKNTSLAPTLNLSQPNKHHPPHFLLSPWIFLWWFGPPAASWGKRGFTDFSPTSSSNNFDPTNTEGEETGNDSILHPSSFIGSLPMEKRTLYYGNPEQSKTGGKSTTKTTRLKKELKNLISSITHLLTIIGSLATCYRWVDWSPLIILS